MTKTTQMVQQVFYLTLKGTEFDLSLSPSTCKHYCIGPKYKQEVLCFKWLSGGGAPIINS